MAQVRKSRGSSGKRSGASRRGRAASSRKGGVSGGAGKLWRRLVWLVVILLAVYGGHSGLLRLAPGYSGRVRQAESVIRLALDKLNSWRSRTVEAVKPLPTITIKGPDDLGKTRYDNLSVGVPGWKCDVILDRAGYALGFSDAWKQPVWVSYKLTADEVRSKKAKRTDDFRPDPAIPNGSATLADYRGSRFDRGHLAPAADMSWSIQAMSESFYMSNMSPQTADCNRGIWKELETLVREFAIRNKEIYVVTGPVFLPDRQVITVGASRVAVPHAYYKVILDMTPPETKAIGFIVPNSGSKKPLSEFAVTVDAVERATGLDFFNRLDPELEAKLESECDYPAWNRP